jgi:hypothetical protein
VPFVDDDPFVEEQFAVTLDDDFFIGIFSLFERNNPNLPFARKCW